MFSPKASSMGVTEPEQPLLPDSLLWLKGTAWKKLRAPIGYSPGSHQPSLSTGAWPSCTGQGPLGDPSPKVRLHGEIPSPESSSFPLCPRPSSSVLPLSSEAAPPRNLRSQPFLKTVTSPHPAFYPALNWVLALSLNPRRMEEQVQK